MTATCSRPQIKLSRGLSSQAWHCALVRAPQEPGVGVCVGVNSQRQGFFPQELSQGARSRWRAVLVGRFPTQRWHAASCLSWGWDGMVPLWCSLSPQNPVGTRLVQADGV